MDEYYSTVTLLNGESRVVEQSPGIVMDQLKGSDRDAFFCFRLRSTDEPLASENDDPLAKFANDWWVRIEHISSVVRAD
jgi:hypothetical protein